MLMFNVLKLQKIKFSAVVRNVCKDRTKTRFFPQARVNTQAVQSWVYGRRKNWFSSFSLQYKMTKRPSYYFTGTGVQLIMGFVLFNGFSHRALSLRGLFFRFLPRFSQIILILAFLSICLLVAILGLFANSVLCHLHCISQPGYSLIFINLIVSFVYQIICIF